MLNYGNEYLLCFFSQYLDLFSWISFAVSFLHFHLFSQVKVLLTDLQNGFMTGKVKFKINTFQEHILNMTMKNVFTKKLVSVC